MSMISHTIFMKMCPITFNFQAHRKIDQFIRLSGENHNDVVPNYLVAAT